MHVVSRDVLGMTMDPGLKATYERQVQGWREELKQLGMQLDEAKFDHEIEIATVMVKDLKVRMRMVCDELGISTDGSESLHTLVRKILDKLDG